MLTLRSNVKRHSLARCRRTHLWLAILFCAIAAQRLAFLVWPFWGLEYEDSYVYADTARYMGYEYPWEVDPWRTKVILSGNFSSPNLTGSFDTHYEAFPVFLALWNKLLGYSPSNAAMANCIFSLAGLLCMFRYLQTQASHPLPRISLVAICYLVSPMASIYHTSGFAEVSSSTLVLIAVLVLLLRQNAATAARRVTYSIIFLVIQLLAFSIKKENAILSIGPAILFLHGFVYKRESRDIALMLASSCLGLLLLACFRLDRTLLTTSAEIGAREFSLFYFIENGPRLLESFVRLDMWGPPGVAVLFGLLKIVKEPKRADLLLVASLGMAYLFLYSFHFRSPYQLRGEPVDAFDMQRLGLNIFPLFVLLIALNDSLLRLVQKRIGLVVFPLVLLTFIGYGLKQRAKYSEIENVERIGPVKHALGLLNGKGTFYTDIPSVARIFAVPEQNIVDTTALESSQQVIENHEAELLYPVAILSRPGEQNYALDYFRGLSELKSETVLFHSYELLIFCPKGQLGPVSRSSQP